MFKFMRMKKDLICKRLVACLLCVTLLSQVTMPVLAEENTQQNEEESIRILFVGNSFTRYGSQGYGVPYALDKLAKQNNKNIDITTIANNSAHLSYYANYSENYKAYHQQVMTAIMTQQWDYVVLQDFSRAPMECYNTEMYPAVETLSRYVSIYQDKAKVLLYQTHGYNDGTKTKLDGNSVLLTDEQMQKYIALGYARLHATLGLDVVPVGMEFLRCKKIYPKLNLFSSDNKHPNMDGYLLAAATFYYQLYGEVPKVDVGEIPSTVASQEDLSKLMALPKDKMVGGQEYFSINVNDTVPLTYSLQTESYFGDGVYWESLNNAIATVNSSGYITGKTAGTTGIVATSTSGMQCVFVVTVKDAPTQKLAFGQSQYIVGQGDTFGIYPMEETHIDKDRYRWSSSATKIATVSPRGVVNAIRPGKTTITVVDSRNKSVKASYTLYVRSRQVRGLQGAGSSLTATKAKTVLNWTPVNGATQYVIYRATKSSSEYVPIGTTVKNQYVDQTISTDIQYTYKVAASGGHEQTIGEASNKVTIKVLGAVKNFKIQATKKGLKISWNRKPSKTCYEVYRSTKKKSGYKKVATITNYKKNYYFDKKIKAKKKYYYKVKVYKIVNGKKVYSKFSTVVSGKRL